MSDVLICKDMCFIVTLNWGISLNTSQVSYLAQFAPCKISLCQADAVPKLLLIIMAVITFKYKMHVISKHWQQIGHCPVKLMRKHEVSVTSKVDPAGPTVLLKHATNFSLKSHNLVTAEPKYQQKRLGECRSDLEVHQIIQAMFSKGVCRAV